MACRLMSGFVDSLKSGHWRPSGAPAIRRMIDALDQSDHELRLVFSRGLATGVERQEIAGLANRRISLAGLTTPVDILIPHVAGPRRIAQYIQEFARAWALWREARRFRPDLIYVDRSNVVSGAVLARLTQTPVFLRVLGVPPDLHAMLDSKRFGARLLRWAYRAPFAFVCCSRDGSAGESWMARALDPNVPREIILNGVERPATSEVPAKTSVQLPEGRMIVVHLGRVEALKGCDFFVDAILSLPEEYRSRMHALVVGSGSLLEALTEQVAQAGAEENFTFTGAVPNDEIGELLAACDVYVSLNLQGQLTNTNLEAMAAGLCLILRRVTPDNVPDPELAAILPEEAVIDIAMTANPSDLAAVLKDLIDDPERRLRQAERVSEAAAANLWSWQSRIAHETATLDRIAMPTGT